MILCTYRQNLQNHPFTRVFLSGWVPCPSFPHRRRSFVGSLHFRPSLFVVMFVQHCHQTWVNWHKPCFLLLFSPLILALNHLLNHQYYHLHHFVSSTGFQHWRKFYSLFWTCVGIYFAKQKVSTHFTKGTFLCSPSCAFVELFSHLQTWTQEIQVEWDFFFE